MVAGIEARTVGSLGVRAKVHTRGASSNNSLNLLVANPRSSTQALPRGGLILRWVLVSGPGIFNYHLGVPTGS